MSRVAAIDCGTNSIRMLIADVGSREGETPLLRDVHREMRVVRLGQGVDATGTLAPEALRRTEAALRDYASTAAGKGVVRLRMVATSAMRDVANRDEFFAMTSRLLGAPAEVISGEEEALLSFTGAVADASPDEGPFLVVDVGGGSTELVLGQWCDGAARVQASHSVDIGCVRLTERALAGDPPSESSVAEASALVTELLAPAFEAVPVAKAATWIGVAGTVTTLSALAMRLPTYDAARIHNSVLSAGQISAISAELLAMPRAERAQLGAMHPGRVDVIGGGALVVRVLAEQLAERAGITELRVSEHDILDGIALSLGRGGHADTAGHER